MTPEQAIISIFLVTMCVFLINDYRWQKIMEKLVDLLKGNRTPKG